MTKATILSLEQTDAAGLFTIIFKNENQSEFVKFVNRFKDDAVRKTNLESFSTKSKQYYKKVLKNVVSDPKEK